MTGLFVLQVSQCVLRLLPGYHNIIRSAVPAKVSIRGGSLVCFFGEDLGGPCAGDCGGWGGEVVGEAGGCEMGLLDDYDTHSEPHEAWQLRQWQSPPILGKEGDSMATLIAPQLQAPRILSAVEVILGEY